MFTFQRTARRDAREASHSFGSQKKTTPNWRWSSFMGAKSAGAHCGSTSRKTGPVRPALDATSTRIAAAAISDGMTPAHLHPLRKTTTAATTTTAAATIATTTGTAAAEGDRSTSRSVPREAVAGFAAKSAASEEPSRLVSARGALKYSGEV